MSLSIRRYSCARNTFFVIDQRSNSNNQTVDKENRRKLVKSLCLEWFSFSTDGVLFIQEPTNQVASVAWDFYNADGSTAEMCGNASRAAIHFVSTEEHLNVVTLETLAGLINGKLLSSNQAQVHLTEPSSSEMLTIEVNGNKIQGYFINTGVPHFVVFQKPDLVLAEALRVHSKFGPKNTNVTFVDDHQLESGAYRAVTLERGVDGYTQACGTGAVAAGKALQDKLSKNNFLIEMPGGILGVNLESSHPILSGPVIFEFEFNLNGEFYEKI